jgi:hypothetical protein
MMNLLSTMANRNVSQWLGDAWRYLARQWKVRRSEGRLQRLQRKVRRLDRQCTSLQRRMHPNGKRHDKTGFGTVVDADWC